jgi:hypothetical protein
MRVHTPEAAKAARRDTNAFEIRKLDVARIAHHHVFNMAFAIDERPNLPTSLMGKFGKLSRKFRCNNQVRGNTSCVEFFYPAKLVRL